MDDSSDNGAMRISLRSSSEIEKVPFGGKVMSVAVFNWGKRPVKEENDREGMRNL